MLIGKARGPRAEPWGSPGIRGPAEREEPEKGAAGKGERARVLRYLGAREEQGSGGNDQLRQLQLVGQYPNNYFAIVISKAVCAVLGGTGALVFHTQQLA